MMQSIFDILQMYKDKLTYFDLLLNSYTENLGSCISFNNDPGNVCLLE